jgi:transposase
MAHYSSKAHDIEAYRSFEKQSLLFPAERKLLQKILQQENLSKKYSQRIEIMLLADEGKTQAQICERLGCSQVTARHWIFVAQSGQAHNWDNFPIGRPKLVNEDYLKRLEELVKQSPRDHGYSFQRWTIHWLKKHLTTEFGIEISERHLKRLLKEMGLSTILKPKNISEMTNKNLTKSNLLIYDLN